MKLFGTMKINDKNHLELGGLDVVDLATKYKTPLYIMDQQLIEDNMKLMKDSFSSDTLKTRVIYASKAFLNLAMCQIVERNGLCMDVVSGGELYTAMRAGFPMDKVYFHGNNKTKDELEMAIEYGVARIIVDNEHEISMLSKILSEKQGKSDVLLRLNPGIDAHTHEYIQTSKFSSKFGVSIFDDNTLEIIKTIDGDENINLKGFHCHIGSQVFDSNSFIQASKVMLDYIEKVKETTAYSALELNIGGGFGVYYEKNDTPVDIKSCLREIINIFESEIEKRKLDVSTVMIEPGRSIVANSGITIYKTGAVKETFSGKKYVFVDGGMTDNPRPALYQAIYEACVANNMKAQDSQTITIAGKCCESGDVLVHDARLADISEGDFIAVSATGAYNYSMASNYNRIVKPAVVIVKDGVDNLIVKRETYDDLLRNDISLY